MLNLAIKKALKQACDQRGSLCDDEKLRFDFAYGKPLTEAELQATQDHVNKQIADGLTIHTKVSGLEDAKKINGLRAVFGEQYPDPVRVMAVGGPGIQEMIDSPTEEGWEEYSTEFCGGTHIANSSEAKKFALISEEGLGKGVRRVLGVTAEKAEAAFAEATKLSARFQAAESLKGKDLEAENAELLKLLGEAEIPAVDRKRLQDKVMALKKKAVDESKGGAKEAAAAAKAEAEALADAAAASPTAPIIALLQAEADAKALEGAVSAVTAKLPEAPVLLIGAGKTVAALAVVPKALEGSLSAKDWVNAALESCGGKGGGKPGRAQGAARDPSNAKAAEAAAKEFASSKLGN